MGLRARLWQLSRAHGGAAAVPRALQLQASTRLPRQEGTGHEVEQPRWELQLAPARQLDHGEGGPRSSKGTAARKLFSSGRRRANHLSAARAVAGVARNIETQPRPRLSRRRLESFGWPETRPRNAATTTRGRTTYSSTASCGSP